MQHAPAGGQQAWSVSFAARTPGEIIAGFTDALTHPGAAAAPAVDPQEPLRRAGWRDTRDGDGLTSPDGIAHVEHFTGGASNGWFATAAVGEDRADIIWRAWRTSTGTRRLT
ncbi:DUF317 domain-containing protein [Streptomyces sp. NBC_00133]|uniref:DUF317 domain-containing protein n=1 Tax=Streptomyces sp. NBC_00133 TaxID=2903624 RepID=UPI0032478AEA